MNYPSEKSKTCSFTGHRPEKLGISEKEAKEFLRAKIVKAIADGYTNFISGMARGIDLWAAEIVLEKKKENEDIKLLCAIPFPDFEKKWEDADKDIYCHILKNADDVTYVCSHYIRSAFQLRNVYMVDRSSRLIAAFNGEKGGTKNTVDYANKKLIETENIF